MDHLEPSSNSLDQDRVLGPYLGRSIVRSNHELGVHQRDCASLDLTRTGIAISPDLDVVAKTRPVVVKVVQEDCLLTFVAVPPFVLRLEIETRVLFARNHALAYPRWTIIPHPPNIVMILCFDKHIVHTSCFDQLG